MSRGELIFRAGFDTSLRQACAFNVRRRRRFYAVVLVSLIGASTTFAQDAMTPDGTAIAPEKTAQAEPVIVTGSNIPTADETGPNPVDTYNPDDLERLGVRDATDLTEKLPAILGGSANQNSSNGVPSTGAPGEGRTEVNLRGLFPKETLVLVDGKRVAPVGFALFSSVDINLIPFPLTDHIDILKDGASAIYGSDAVAGVLNAVFIHKFRGVETEASYGNTNLGSSNDAAEREGYILAGLGDAKTDIVFFAEYYDRDAIFSRDRGISSNADYKSYGGTDARSGNFPGRVGSFVLRPGLTNPTPHSAPNAASSGEYVPRTSLPIADQLFNFAALTAAVPAADREYLYGSLTRDLLDKYLTVFADVKFARSFFERVLAPVPFAPDPFHKADGVTSVSSAGISVPLSNPFNPFTVPDAFLPDGTPVTTGVRYRALEAGLRVDDDTTDDLLFDAGFRGNLGEFGDYFKTWNYEIGFRSDSNDIEEASGGIVSSSGLRAALLDTNPATAFDPFGRNVNTKAALARVLVTTHHTGRATLTEETVSLYGDLFRLPAAPLSFALGAEHRGETVNDMPDVLNTRFDTIGDVDLQASRGSRDVWSTYGELRIPITSPSWKLPGLYNLEFQLAERIELYSDTDTAERPKFSVRYQPFDSSLTLRAGYTEAFHAPDLSDLSPAAELSGVTAGPEGLIDPSGKTPDGVAIPLLVGGQPKLRPEVAYGFNYGAVWTPRFVPGLTLSADYYHIDLRDRTNFIDPQFVVDENFASGGRRFPGQVERNSSGAITLVRDLTQNISRTIVEGIDYELIYSFDTAILGAGGFGKLTFTINGTYLSRYVATINVNDPEREWAGQETFFAGYLPHNRLYGSIFYDLGGLDTGVVAHFIGQGSDVAEATNLGTPRKIREWTTFDAIISYTFKSRPMAGRSDVAGDGKEDPKDARNDDNVSTADGSPWGWRALLRGTKITFGMTNIFDLDPPFVAFYSGNNGYDESAFDIRGRFCYISVKKRF
jgi:iron complex outermembrane recepter protein